MDCRSNLEDKGDHSLESQLEGQQMADVMYHFEGGRLVEIYGYFDSSRFATVEAALTEKLGKPKSKTILEIS